MPVMSFSISSVLKKFLTKMAQTNDYKSNSNVVRVALTRLMDVENVGGAGEITSEQYEKIAEQLPQILGSVMLAYNAKNEKVIRKINRLEVAFKELIKTRNATAYGDQMMCTYTLDGPSMVFHQFVMELNGIDELENFRYMILNE